MKYIVKLIKRFAPYFWGKYGQNQDSFSQNEVPQSPAPNINIYITNNHSESEHKK